jgi:ABC-type nitrate/sulfonate/bicarbonate transport system permease component
MSKFIVPNKESREHGTVLKLDCLKWLPGIVPYIASFAMFLLLWHVAAVYIYKSALFPPPVAVLAKTLELIRDGTLLTNIAASLKRIASGFALGTLLGVPIGLTIGSFPIARKLLEPWTEFLRFIPATAMITIAVIWFGIGEQGKIFLILYTTIFIIILNTASGVSAVGINMTRSAQALGASKWQIYRLVTLPATVPFILTGMRLAMANAFTTIVAAEMVSASSGLGVMLWNGRLFMLIDEIFVSLVTLGALGFLADRLFRLAIYKFAHRYSPVT